MSFRVALLGVLLVAAAAASAAGQGFQGGLRGAAKDAGGVVPGVEVTLTNDSTNKKRSTTTNERGEYVFAAVEPGTYKVTATLQGYKTVDQSGIRIGTQTFIVLDLTLELGTLSESVTVVGQSPVIETANASQGTVLDSAALQTLPAPGRNAFMIGTTVPTVIPSGDAQFNRQQDQTNASLLSLGGGTRRGNNYTLDGVPITDMRNRASANPTIEALEDLKVQVYTYDAEMGRTGGGVFNTTLKTGTNNFHGAAFFQTRPIWAAKNNYFSEKAGIPKPTNPYYLGGGAFGGPIVKNRTFFYFASENYHDVQTRNASEVMPTASERAGDFSGLLNSRGQNVIIYNPQTTRMVNGAIVRDPFPGNKIPANRLNAVALAMLKYLPLPDTNIDNSSTNYNRTSLINNKFEQEYTIKVGHKFTDNVSLSGFYLYNRTDEPCANYFSSGGNADQNDPNRFADPGDYLLKRRPQILALNSTWVLSNSSVMALRFGLTRFPDDNTLTADFDPASLAFSPTYLSQITLKKFPQVDIQGYDNFFGRTLGAINPTRINWKSMSANGAVSKLVGTHTFKAGADFRKIGVDTYIPGNGAGSFTFDREFTSASGSNSSLTDGNAFASYLLGYPSGNPSRLAQLTVTTPFNLLANYYGGYVQDDWRVRSSFTLNYGLRVEHEDGLRERDNKVTVGFDPTATSALSSVTIAADPVAGTPARQVAGGLLYAGVNGSKVTQGNPPKAKFSPRLGAVWSINTTTVLRGGYGLYWAPWNYPVPSTSANNYGQVGYTNNTSSPQNQQTPSVTLDNPFPTGIVPPSGNARGVMSGVGTTISYVDQNRTAPRVQRYSADLQHALPGSMAITISYVGSRGSHLGLGGTGDTPVNINQLDPKYMALGSALTQTLENPFFGNPNAGPLATQARLTRAQLLRPYPQFLNVNARQVTEGVSRYNAGVIEWTKRPTHGWGGRISYTYSVLKDNQVGEGNFYSQVNSGNPLNSYNYISSAPACSGAPFTTACFDPLSDYGYGILDVPHRVIIAPIVELPFGRGKKWANNGMANLIAGGWTVSTSINIQSGFPINVNQSDNTGTFSNAQRPNLVAGADLATPGGYYDRLASADHPSNTWLNASAFTLAGNNTIGNAPRTITGVRTPDQKNVDAMFIKSVGLGGGKQVQVRIELLNLLNRVTLRGDNVTNTVGSSTFERWNTQSGFARITQIMFRFQF
jgi:hypothetical protein